MPVRDSQILRELTQTGGVDVAAIMKFVRESTEIKMRGDVYVSALDSGSGYTGGVL